MAIELQLSGLSITGATLLTLSMAYAKATGNGRAFPATGGFTLPDSSIVAPDTTHVTEEASAAYVAIVPNVVFELLVIGAEMPGFTLDAKAIREAAAAPGS